MEKTQQKYQQEYGIIVTMPSEDDLLRQTVLELALHCHVVPYALGSEDSLTLKSKSKEDIQRLKEKLKQHDLDVVIKKLP